MTASVKPSSVAGQVSTGDTTSATTVDTTVGTTDRPLPIVIVGHVDHGKSTLVGRLLHEVDALPAGKVDALREMSRRRGMPFEWSFVMDALQAERDQGITIDTTQIRFSTELRTYVVIDAPGHKEFLKNMITGAASADAALLVIDAAEGVLEQSRRHAYILHLLGVRQVAVAVNKMDAVGYDEARFAEVEGEIRRYLSEIGVTPDAVIPISARNGDNIASRSENTPWYKGPTIVRALDAFKAPPALTERPLRLPVQDVYKLDHRRIIAGRIESGRIRVGDTLVFSPGGKKARIASIESWNETTPRLTAIAGQSVGITLDEQIFVERGNMASLEEQRPVETRTLRVRLFWLGHSPLRLGARYMLKLATSENPVTVQSIERVIDVEDLSGRSGDEVHRNEVAEIVLQARTPIAVDDFQEIARTGRGVLVDGYDLVGGCIVDAPTEDAGETQVKQAPAASNIHAVADAVGAEARAASNGHRGGILWFTGLSGAGKSTVALALERALFERGLQAFVLDGDTIRHGLNSNLGFSPEDRSENIRRVAEVARLFAEAGMIVIASLISPTRADRDRARSIGNRFFHEVYIRADLKTCEGRDPKGLYAKARAGEIAEFTGISAPYEEPAAPELTLDTVNRSVEELVADAMAYIERTFVVPTQVRRIGAE